MSLLCLAVLGKDNEPLYLCDVSSDSSIIQPDDEDVFGFASSCKTQNDSLSLHQEFMFHAAIDRLAEVCDRGPGHRWRNPISPGANSSWIGLLCPMENSRIYGYVTTTHIKFLGMVEDPVDGGVTHRDADLKALFSDIHNLYVKYSLNPFTALRKKIESKEFDKGVTESVLKFNDKASASTEKLEKTGATTDTADKTSEKVEESKT